jgi:hypothetical protein
MRASNRYHNLAELPALLEVAMHIHHLVKGKDLINHHLERAALKAFGDKLDRSRTTASLPLVSQMLWALIVGTLAIICNTRREVTW